MSEQVSYAAETLALHAGQVPDPEQQATGVTPDFIRLSIGTENVNDIIADLDQALAVL